LVAAVVAGCVAFGGPVVVGTALAQSNPSASELINALKPTGLLSDTTRGIKPLGPEDDAAPMHGAMPASMNMAPAANISAPSANLSVDFASGSAVLTPQAEATLDQLGKALTSPELASYNFKIAGHTDTVGDAAVNQTLSEARAAAVKSYLESKFGVSDARLQAVGLGESDLLVPTPPETPNYANRRVQIINLGQ
jgi:outer membrane protein OmpA-like peptidoglycan-associated protein